MELPGVVKISEIEVLLDNPNVGIQALMCTLRPEWKWEDIIVNKLEGGINNHLFACHQKTDIEVRNKIVVRIHGQKTEILMSPEDKALTYAIFHAAGCGPPLYAIFKNGIAYGYVPGNTLSMEEWKDPHISKLIARCLARVHAIDPSSVLPTKCLRKFHKDKELVLLTAARKLHSKIPTNLPDILAERGLSMQINCKEEFKKEYEMLMEEINVLDTPVVFSHSDLNPNNIVYNKETDEVTIIDHDLAGYNFQAYDIANYFCYCTDLQNGDIRLYPDKKNQVEFLSTYLQSYKHLTGMSEVVKDIEIERFCVTTAKFTKMFCLLKSIIFLGFLDKDDAGSDMLERAVKRIGVYFALQKKFKDLKMP